MERRKRRFTPNKPGSDFTLVGETSCFQVYAKPVSETGWANLKVIAKLKKAKKANYWLGWSVDDARLANNKDAGILQEHHEDELAELLEWLREQKGWPIQTAGLNG